MTFNECQRCNGNLLIERHIGSRLEGLVCLRCGHRQAAQTPGPGLTMDLTGSRRPVDGKRRIAAVYSDPPARREKTITINAQRGERKLVWLPRFANGDVRLSEHGTRRLLAHMLEDMPDD